MEVDKDNLRYVVESWVDTFNDCACCPIYLECDTDHTHDCPDEIINKFLTIGGSNNET